MPDARRRAFVAALVGVVGASLGIAGAGHVYLREWRRALAWFTFVIGAVLVLLSTVTDPASVGSLSTIESVSALPTTVIVPVVGLLFLSALDAYRVGMRSRGRNANGQPTCPVCRGELDQQLDFCPWCATELEWYTVEE
ncbi:zinc ribbon domain-containing protein [Haloferax mediterranei ATCC 33500]|uniref:Zinc ribbon domain-containing protein n=1 Tax=Haloferax mediterranei (strain ATCC 33500 / DSM 1411 / JCM 8866 / NBRC 14739 / NCIMB 2177 / R-4) TaxID=523841 RepID=I3R2M1_HALMT|nr:hypothetical protein [Haloferax mediterranei]AFK18481.1 hypothetical protein HFX_0758 [Haloferax mediterranei ATCC 33500]AHZ22137.1 hypothetical protein BM92_05455 [Haloferax mediterranei ATCC 33500]EMA02246.1 hypothetical protein C439_06685 [Haloferax mediterranei ATCC 33500]MDX5988571.1 zinc ribbon domain-containing protein [Haloferax mediterranei ATCC 33500]QCQ74985.1 zinc ribbon domain-containing protein [Haloferax mediterranei ATCC 33500]